MRDMEVKTVTKHHGLLLMKFVGCFVAAKIVCSGQIKRRDAALELSQALSVNRRQGRNLQGTNYPLAPRNWRPQSLPKHPCKFVTVQRSDKWLSGALDAKYTHRYE